LNEASIQRIAANHSTRDGKIGREELLAVPHLEAPRTFGKALAAAV